LIGISRGIQGSYQHHPRPASRESAPALQARARCCATLV
jgi:hypothetical protein